MHVVHKFELPLIGMSHEFVGKEQGQTGISFFLVSTTERGRGVRLHKHDYDEVVHILEGQSTWTIGGEQVIATAGDTVVVCMQESRTALPTVVRGSCVRLTFTCTPVLRPPGWRLTLLTAAAETVAVAAVVPAALAPELA